MLLVMDKDVLVTAGATVISFPVEFIEKTLHIIYEKGDE